MTIFSHIVVFFYIQKKPVFMDFTKKSLFLLCEHEIIEP